LQTQQKIILLITLSFLGCSDSIPSEFKAAANQARKMKFDLSETPQNKLPFFSHPTLTPTWSESFKIVSAENINWVDHNNKPISDATFTEHPTVLGFFFSSCQGFCPALIQSMQKIEKQFRLNQFNAKFIAVTVDPKTDTPKVLRRYFEFRKLNPKSWHLATGDQESIYRFAKETLVSQAFERVQTKGPRNFVHSEHLYFFDTQKRLRAVFNSTRLDSPEKALNAMKELQKENRITVAKGIYK
jgi:protein SCO1/2